MPDTLLNMDPAKAGQMLAEHWRSAVPREKTEIKGALKIRRSSSLIITVPFIFRIDPGEVQWRASYETASTAEITAEKLVVVHTPDKPNEYLYARAKAPGEAPPEPAPIKVEQAFVPLGQSDFWLVDLGLDFLHWPKQRLLKGEMRMSRYAYVLESQLAKAPTNGYARVVSWIDKESGGPLAAEAYGADGKLLKEFSIDRLQKVEGRWELKEMKIRNAVTKSQTRMEFRYDTE